MREAPGPALCRLRAARSGALLPAGARRAPHGCGASARGGASVAGVAAARTASRGRDGGGIATRVGSAARPQAPPLAVLITGASNTTGAPGVARVRTPPGGPFQPPPPPRVSMGGAHSLSGSGMLDGRGELRRPLPLPPPSLPLGRAPGQGGGSSRGSAAGAAGAGKNPGRPQ